jgi:hypothetical protein
VLFVFLANTKFVQSLSIVLYAYFMSYLQNFLQNLVTFFCGSELFEIVWKNTFSVTEYFSKMQ